MPFHQLNRCSNVLIARGAAYSFKLLVQQKEENICKEESVSVSLPSGCSVFKSIYNYYKKNKKKKYICDNIVWLKRLRR